MGKVYAVAFQITEISKDKEIKETLAASESETKELLERFKTNVKATNKKWKAKTFKS
jgi:hypothetical protein